MSLGGLSRTSNDFEMLDIPENRARAMSNTSSPPEEEVHVNFNPMFMAQNRDLQSEVADLQNSDMLSHTDSSLIGSDGSRTERPGGQVLERADTLGAASGFLQRTET